MLLEGTLLIAATSILSKLVLKPLLRMTPLGEDVQTILRFGLAAVAAFYIYPLIIRRIECDTIVLSDTCPGILEESPFRQHSPLSDHTMFALGKAGGFLTAPARQASSESVVHRSCSRRQGEARSSGFADRLDSLRNYYPGPIWCLR